MGKKVRILLLGIVIQALKLVTTCFLLTFHEAVAGWFRRKREFVCAHGKTPFQCRGKALTPYGIGGMHL